MQWYQVAADEGHADAQGAVERLKAQMAGALSVAEDSNQTLAAADLVEPAAGEEGEGDSSPIDEGKAAVPPPVFKDTLVYKIQQALASKGLLPKDTVNGQQDARTEDAIRAWQAKAGMPADGQPSQAVLEKLNAEKK
jgi:peptidoglycan hydrolase-like protein with peptidoglycan-binding domain